MPESNKKIVILGPTPPPYMGPSIATDIILNSKLSSEFDLIHLDTSDRRELSNLGKIDFWNIYLALKHYLQLVWLLLTKQPAVVYIPVSQTTVGYLRDAGFILITKLCQKKVVCHLRGSNFRSWLDHAGKVMQWLVFNVHSLADAQIVLGKNLQYIFEDIIPKDKIFVVPNGADYPDLNINRVQSHSEPVLLYIANPTPAKGVNEVLDSLVVLKNRLGKSFPLVLAGKWRDGQYKKDSLTKISENNLSVNIAGGLTGSAKYNALKDADIFVFPPRAPEGHPWVIVEALAAGLPIISTDQGTITESVFHGVNGFIVEAGQPEQIAEKILYLAENPDVREKMGRESRRIYEKYFTEEKMVENFTRCFNAVLNQ